MLFSLIHTLQVEAVFPIFVPCTCSRTNTSKQSLKYPTAQHDERFPFKGTLTPPCSFHLSHQPILWNYYLLNEQKPLRHIKGKSLFRAEWLMRATTTLFIPLSEKPMKKSGFLTRALRFSDFSTTWRRLPALSSLLLLESFTSYRY